MKRIEKIRELGKIVDGVQQIVADIMVSTVEDLPGAGETFCGSTLLPGTIALVAQTCTFYVLDDDGNWYTKGGAE